MKHGRDDDEDTPDYSLRQKKRLKDAHLPRTIRFLPHVMKRINQFAMTIVLEALELALKHDHYKAARVICENSKIPGEIYKWSAEHDDAQVFDDVYYHRGDSDMDNLYRALLIAVSRGCVHITKTALGRRGAELLDYVDGDDSSPCPLVTAIKHGQREMVDFLYAHDTGCEDDSYVPAFCTAAAYGPLELAKMFYDKEKFDGPALELAFASAASRSQLETMTYL